MGVTEDRNPVGLEVESAPRRRHDALGRLQRQAVDEVEIERSDAERARRVGARLRLRVGLLAADGLLHRGLEVLYAETDSSYAHGRESLAPIQSERRGVNFDCDLCVGREGETLPVPPRDPNQAVGRQGSWRASSPVQMRDDRPPANQPGDVINLSHQRFRIGST
jgi:hypothetical protein